MMWAYAGPGSWAWCRCGGFGVDGWWQQMAREDFVHQWGARIGPTAAGTNYRYRQLKTAAPLLGSACIVVTAVAAVFSSSVAIVACLVVWLGYFYVIVQSVRARRAAQRQAREYLNVYLPTGRAVPIRSIESFDRWAGSRSSAH